MKERCRTSNKYYGGRGIRVCDRWINNYPNFLEDMGERPKGHTIDRVDVDGNYTPENCRWADRYTQTRNSRTQQNNTSGKRGVTFNKRINKWRAYLYQYGECIHLGYFNRVEDAITARIQAENIYWGQ